MSRRVCCWSGCGESGRDLPREKGTLAQMVAASPREVGHLFISKVVRQVIRGFYWLSPYSWVDEWQRCLETRARASGEDWQRIRHRRYLLSELYVVGWLTLAGLSLLMNRWIPIALALVLLLRVAGIVTKELGVVLFGICKITEGRHIQSPERAIILAFVNYLTAGLLFSLAYSKVGSYEIGAATVRPLPAQQAVIQGLYLQFSLQPPFMPADVETWSLTVSQVAFCFVYGTIIISLFVALLRLGSETDL